MIANLCEDRDRWRRQATSLLMDSQNRIFLELALRLWQAQMYLSGSYVEQQRIH